MVDDNHDDTLIEGTGMLPPDLINPVSPEVPTQVTEGDVHFLRQDIERLLMINEALWTFIKEQHGYTDEDLIKRIAEVDMKDGRLDGKVAQHTAEVLECPRCGRKVGRRRPTCRYCGEPIIHDPFER